MPRNRWHILRDDDVLILARRLPVRFDLSVTTQLPGRSRLRMAQQVRQDMWRALQSVRGFSPVVRVRRLGAQLEVTAGGQIAPHTARAWAEARIDDLLNDPGHRVRWAGWAACRRPCRSR